MCSSFLSPHLSTQKSTPHHPIRDYTFAHGFILTLTLTLILILILILKLQNELLNKDRLSLTPSQLTHREEFFRLKKVQAKKKRDATQAEEKRLAQNAEDAKAGIEGHKDDGIGGGDAGGRDMLDEGKDEDVIF